MITAAQIVAHAIGDYILQSDKMAADKTTKLQVALWHGLLYLLPFYVLAGPVSIQAAFVIVVCHALIDRYRLARYVIWLRNWPTVRLPFSACKSTGYGVEKPVWMAVWLMIIVDNTLHLVINGLALAYLR